jgi:catechol 2,3-dioxygenase-like lactoylglutathione lyase family enzyme
MAVTGGTTTMLKNVTHVGLGVHDQDEALAFWTDKVGFEVRTDMTIPEMGGMRWLTIGPPNEPDVEIILMPPGHPGTPPEMREKANEVLAQGLLPGLIFRVDDCRATYEELKERGVEMTQEPVEQFYGIDAAFRDPTGNHIRFSAAARPSPGAAAAAARSARPSSTSRSRSLRVSEAASSNSARASSKRPSRDSRSPRTAGSRW